MKLSNSMLSVVVITIFLCMLDKHVVGGEVQCNDTPCPDEYVPLCAQAADVEEFQTFKNVCELNKVKCSNGDKTWTIIAEHECTN